MACKVTFSPYIPEVALPAQGIKAGKLQWVSDQSVGGKRSIGRRFIAPETIESKNVKAGYPYLKYQDCGSIVHPPLVCGPGTTLTITLSFNVSDSPCQSVIDCFSQAPITLEHDPLGILCSWKSTACGPGITTIAVRILEFEGSTTVFLFGFSPLGIGFDFNATATLDTPFPPTGDDFPITVSEDVHCSVGGNIVTIGTFTALITQ